MNRQPVYTLAVEIARFVTYVIFCAVLVMAFVVFG
jgi:hypothetical protein